MTTDYLVTLNRSTHSDVTADDYYGLAEWGTAGDGYSSETHALVMVLPGKEAEVEALLERDDDVKSYVLWSERNVSELPALTRNLETVRQHLAAGHRAGYRRTEIASELVLEGDEVRIIASAKNVRVVDDDGGTEVEWNTLPAPAPIEGETAYVLAGPDGDIYADPQGRWLD